jgi:hypothetical protein
MRRLINICCCCWWWCCEYYGTQNDDNVDNSPVDQIFEASVSKKRRRNPDWTQSSVDWLTTWVHEYVRGPIYRGRIDYSACVTAIMNSETISMLFDPSHVTAKSLYEKCKRIAKSRGVLVNEL